MSMNKVLSMFLVFMCIMIIAMFAIGFTSTITAPDISTTAGQQYANLTNTISIADTGINGVMLLIIVAMVLLAIVVMMGAFRRR